MSDASSGPLHEPPLKQQSSRPRWLILDGVLLLMFIIPGLLFLWIRAGDNLVNPNTATREQLLTLPGISTEVADRILVARPFTTETDFLNRVPGIEPQAVQEMRTRLDFDGDGRGDCCVH